LKLTACTPESDLVKKQKWKTHKTLINEQLQFKSKNKMPNENIKSVDY